MHKGRENERMKSKEIEREGGVYANSRTQILRGKLDMGNIIPVYNCYTNFILTMDNIFKMLYLTTNYVTPLPHSLSTVLVFAL